MAHTAPAFDPSTPPLPLVEQQQQQPTGTPAAVLAFPRRASNSALAWIESVDLSPGARLTGIAIADCAAVHSQPIKYRHIEAGDCAAFATGKTIRRKRRGRRVSLRTIRTHIDELVDAGLQRRRTVRTNTYIFPLPARVQNAPGIRAKIEQNCTLDFTPDCTPKELRKELRKEEDQERPRARNTNRPTKTTKPRNRCDCGNTWPAEYGPDCHDCQRAAREQRRRRRAERDFQTRNPGLYRHPAPRPTVPTVPTVINHRAEHHRQIRGLKRAIEDYASRLPESVPEWRRELAAHQRALAALDAQGGA